MFASEVQRSLNLIKSEFGHGSLNFLGHVVGSASVAPIDAKVATINDLPVPRNRRFTWHGRLLSSLLPKLF